MSDNSYSPVFGLDMFCDTVTFSEDARKTRRYTIDDVLKRVE